MEISIQSHANPLTLPPTYVNARTSSIIKDTIAILQRAHHQDFPLFFRILTYFTFHLLLACFFLHKYN